MARFRDRSDAGRHLADLVVARGVIGRPVVLALPRGGAPVAVELAARLDAALDVLLVRKLRTPGHPELACGAVASGGVHWLNPDVPLPTRVTDTLIAREADEIRTLESRYRPPGFVSPSVAGATAILVDDGIATGSTALAAARSARLLGAATVIVAAPIAPPAAVRRLEAVADRVDIVDVRSNFGAVSTVYDDFHEVPDVAVRRMLTQ